MRDLWLYAAICATLLMLSEAAFGNLIQYDGNTANEPTWTRPQVNGLTLATFADEDHFHVQPFFVGETGMFMLSSTQIEWDGMLFLYRDDFDPLLPLVGFVKGNDDGFGPGTSTIFITLQANTQYFLVTTGFDNDESGKFVNIFVGRGVITLGSVPAPGSMALLLLAGAVGIRGSRRRRSAEE